MSTVIAKKKGGKKKAAASESMPAKSPEHFPPLLLGIYDVDGKLCRVVQQNDPRNAFIRAFNEMTFTRGAIAAPLKAGNVQAIA
ncbi:MAG: hypothetical protein ACR2FY_20605 [Pirellulaceae bacterium]